MRAVVVYRPDGLGARLMAFGNGIRLARLFGVPCYLTWNEAWRVGGIGDPAQLLDLARLGPDVTILPLFKALVAIGPGRVLSDGIKPVIDREEVSHADALLCSFAQIQRLSIEEPSPDLQGSFAAAVRGIVPAPPLAERARRFGRTHDLRATIGVHVRRGDLVGHAVERERIRLIGLDRYFAVLDAVAAGERLFLCTEDQSVIDAFRARYPGRVVTYPARSWSRNEADAVADALIEMFLLSATRFIVAGPSAFSRFAAARRAIPLVLLRNDDSAAESVDLAKAAVGALG